MRRIRMPRSLRARACFEHIIFAGENRYSDQQALFSDPAYRKFSGHCSWDPDLVVTLKALHELGVGFVSLTEALDLTTPSGRAMAGMLAVFAEFEREIIREWVNAGLAQARAAGRILGRPPSAAKHTPEVKALFAQGLSQSEIARRVGIGRTSVRRLLT